MGNIKNENKMYIEIPTIVKYNNGFYIDRIAINMLSLGNDHTVLTYVPNTKYKIKHLVNICLCNNFKLKFYLF